MTAPRSPGETCPECKHAKLSFDPGYPGCQDEAPANPVVLCPRCGVDYPVNWDGVQRLQIAEKIAQRLFTNGFGQHAEHLVLDLGNGHNGGGWCESAVVDQIVKILAEESVTTNAEPL